MALDYLLTGMVQKKATVVFHKREAQDHYWMRLHAPEVASRAKPGQFIHILCGKGLSPEGPSPLLRRPFSLLDANPKTGNIDFIYKVVGLGTEALTQFKRGSKVDLLGPLGQPFKIPAGLSSIYLIGGGVGIPPMFLLAKWLKKNSQAQVTVLLGARTKKWVICTDLFKKLGTRTQIATDDGTMGFKGSVVDLLRKLLKQDRVDPLGTALFICGPTPMMAAAAKVAHQEKLFAQVSLEERMGCAMGVCWGCVVEVKTEHPRAHARFQRVCTEGPVFPSEAILWTT